MTQEKKIKKGNNINTKHIALDAITLDFLRSLRSRRKKLGFTLEYVGKNLNIPYQSLITYEKGRNTPLLSQFIKLAEFFHVDISQSINYKFFYRKLDASKIKKSLSFYGLSLVEIASLTGYNERTVCTAVHVKPYASIICLHAVLELIQKEREAYAVRQQIIQKG